MMVSPFQLPRPSNVGDCILQCFVSFTCKFHDAYTNVNVIFADYDYDAEYTLPSNGPPPIQEPPGAYSGKGTSLKNFSSILITMLTVYVSR